MTTKRFRLFDSKTKGDGVYTVNYFDLYRYASRWDLFVIFLGCVCTFLKSLTLPWVVIVYGEFTSLMVERSMGRSSKTFLMKWFGGGRVLENASPGEHLDAMIDDSIAYFILSLISTAWQFVFGIFCVDCFNRTAIRQVTRIRTKYFESLMRQDIGWYDVAASRTNFSIRITEDIEKIKTGLAEDVSHFLNLMFSFVICVVISFIYGWKLTLIVISYLPLVFATNIIIGKLQASSSGKELDAYAQAGSVVEEVLNGIRTVFAFAGEKIESNRYAKLLEPARRAAIRKGLFSSVSDGITRFLFFASAALSFWIGVQWVLDDRDKDDKEYTSASLLIIFFSLVSAADNIAETTPFLLTFSVARGSAKSIFAVIDRVSKIDPLNSSGIKLNPADVSGQIEFRNIHFSYPSRPNTQILHDFNLKIKPGESVALVGFSGNGKSTCLQLLQRFYDPSRGEVLLDGQNIKSLNIEALRSCIATVGQEPVLFSTTIAENIRYGKPQATEDEVIEAAKNSGAHEFIMRLLNGYDTLVGSNGSQLSGGQKQRIAIARALVQNPKILLLDEATSALDYQSEKLVQKALNRASKGRTTIIVSHRLSAIRHADRVLFIEKGRIVEEGTHTQLLEQKGRYFEMVRMQDNTKKKPNPKHRRQLSKRESMEKKKKEKPKVVSESESSSSSSSDSESDEESSIEDNEGSEVPDKVHYWQNFVRIIRLAKPDALSLTIAIIAAFIVGSAFPLFSIVFAEVYGALSISDPNSALDTVFMWCMVFLGLGVFIFIGALNQTYFFTKAGANLTQRIRSMTFQAMLKQECGWFDDHNNSVGALASRLSDDAANIQTAIGYPFSLILQAISTFTTGIIVAFTSSVKLSLICLASVPILLIAVFFEARYLAKSALSEKLAMSSGAKVASEAIANIRTVSSLRQEKYMIERFTTEMASVERLSRKKIIFRGLVNSFSQAVPLLAYAVALGYGGYMVASKEIAYKEIVRISEAMLYGTLFMCQTLVFAPTITTAFIGAHGVFRIIDRQPLITSIKNSKTDEQASNVDFKQIHFQYPTRPDVNVLVDFNLAIPEGRTVALVGHSGSGKSTCIQLLQRLYDPQEGEIFLGKSDIAEDLSLNDLRLKLSIVSQEPVLFNRTIAENIAYGDNSRTVDMSEIIDAAKIANVHTFITQLPEGYETNVGKKATQLSGGQKQRIAIARALIRNPKILLLDEATSALDLQSEQIVQEALDSARSGRTCIIIAHRLSTIENADIICVVQDGAIIESGSHTELLALNKAYTQLYNAQK